MITEVAAKVAPIALGRLSANDRSQVNSLGFTTEYGDNAIALVFPAPLSEIIAQAINGAYGDIKAARDFGGPRW